MCKFNINNLFVGISRNSRIDRVLFVSTKRTIKEKLADILQDDYIRYIKSKEDISKFSVTSLLDEENFYFDKDMIENKRELEIFNHIINCDLSKFEKLNFVSSKRNNLDEYDKIRFLLLDTSKELIFYYINSRTTIRDRTFMELIGLFHEQTTMSVNSILDIEQGINIPDNITCVWNFEAEKLIVLNAKNFETMIHLREINKEKAKLNFNKFINGIYKVGDLGNQYSISFEDSELIKEEILRKSRYTNRLANFTPDIYYSIERIKTAVSRLNSNDQVKFDDANKTIIVETVTYPTFLAIIHDSIVERLISGDVENAI